MKICTKIEHIFLKDVKILMSFFLNDMIILLARKEEKIVQIINT